MEKSNNDGSDQKRSDQNMSQPEDWHEEQDEQKMDVDEGDRGDLSISPIPITVKQQAPGGGGEPLTQTDSSGVNIADQVFNGVPIQKKELIGGGAGSEVEKILAQEKKQSEEEERKMRLKSTVTKLYKQMKDGCSKDICFNLHCKKNPFWKQKLAFTDQERLKEAVKLCSENKDHQSLICSDSVSMNSKRLEDSTEKLIEDLLNDADAFSSSFVLTGSGASIKEHSGQDVVMTDQSALMQQQSSKGPVDDYDYSALNEVLIDFNLLDIYIQRLHNTVHDNSQKLNNLVKSLVDLTFRDYQFSPKYFHNALKVWRSMLMLLQLQDFLEWDWNSTLIQVLKCMNYPHEQLRKTKETDKLIAFMKQALNKHRMSQVVQKIQSSITISIVSGDFDPKDIERAVRVLDVINEANNKKPLAERIDYRDFYNDAINKDVNLRDHFEHWIIEREKCRKNNIPFDRLKIFTLCSFPWILDSANKSELLKIANKVNQARHQDQDFMQLLFQGQAAFHLMFEVSRDNILDDTLNVIVKPGINYQKPLRVVFKGEPGIDEGGVRKEFFQLLIRRLFDPDYGMFTFNERQVLYYLNGHSHEPNINFELIGILMGLAIYNNIILDVSFPLACYKLLVFEEPNFDDLKEWQPEIAQSLEFILNYNDEVPLKDALEMNFTIQVENFGVNEEVELIPGGSEIFVTEENRQKYVDLYIKYMFVTQCEDKLRAFKRGFYKVCDEELMSQLFKPQELEQLICGSKVLDFYAWQKNCRFIEGYTSDSPQAKWLWEIIHDDFNDEQRKKFLAFCTGSDRAPILGLGTVKLYVGRHGEDSEMLPSSHTCFNHLLIPEYSSKEKLRQKLLLAINNAEGFGLM